MRKCLLFALLLLLCSFAEAKKKPYKPCATLLCPSRESLIRQNLAVDRMGIPRISNEKELASLVTAGKLSALPNGESLRASPSLPANRRYVLPMVNSFLVKLASEYYAEFHLPLMVDSAVRSRDVQRKLRRYNHSAAPVDGKYASSHETGATVDLSRRMTKRQEKWTDWRLTYYVLRNLVIVEKEKHCYHVMVIGEANAEDVSTKVLGQG